MLAKVLSAALVGLDAVHIEVEIDIASQGLPNFFMVGLPDKAVEEAKERVRSAIRNSGADFPARKITVNLAPADLPHLGEDGTAHAEQAEDVGVELGAHALVRDRLDRTRLAVAGVVDQHADGALGLLDRRHGGGA